MDNGDREQIEGFEVSEGRSRRCWSCRQSDGSVALCGGHTAKEVYRLCNGVGNRYGGVEGVRTRRTEIDEGHMNIDVI